MDNDRSSSLNVDLPVHRIGLGIEKVGFAFPLHHVSFPPG